MEPERLLLRDKRPNQKCTCGCPILDRLLDGGIPCNSITEIAGESGTGKTQICLQLLLSAQLPVSHGGLGASTIFLHSEFPFPSRRLHQLCISFLSLYPNLFPSGEPRDHIFVRGVHSAEELINILDQLHVFLSDPPSNLPVKLIVIDSVAALFRAEFDNTLVDLKKRSSLFFRISAKLKLHAKRFGVAVVVTNQVVDVVGENNIRIGNYACLYSSGRKVLPALGLSWANCVNSRLFLSRNNDIFAKNYVSNDPSCRQECFTRARRKLQVVFSPHLPEASCEFVIVREGLFGLRL